MNLIYLHYQEVKEGVNNGLEFFESCFDGAGKVPYLSTISGGIRFLYGNIELIAGIALSIIWRIASFYAENPADQQAFREEATRVLDYTVHGIANMVRGYVECIRWVNLICIVYDKFLEGEKDRLRLNYHRPIELFQYLKA